MIDEIDLNRIQDENARELILRLMNLVEKLSVDLRKSQEENQQLRDEINRLKKGSRVSPRSMEMYRNQAKIITLRKKNGRNHVHATNAAREMTSASTES